VSIHTIYESVWAGFWAPAEEQSRFSVDLEQYIIDAPISSILVRVKWDSMIDAGIFPGDIAIVDKAKTPKQWDIIIANIDYKYTIKYLEQDSEWRDYLRPANDNYMNIYPSEELRVFWVVTGIIRKY